MEYSTGQFHAFDTGKLMNNINNTNLTKNNRYRISLNNFSPYFPNLQNLLSYVGLIDDRMNYTDKVQPVISTIFENYCTGTQNV